MLKPVILDMTTAVCGLYGKQELHNELLKIMEKANLSLSDIEKITRLNQNFLARVSSGEMNIPRQIKYQVLYAKQANQLVSHLEIIDKMTRWGYFPIPETYSSKCRGILAQMLYIYFQSKLNNRSPLDSFKDVMQLESSMAEKSTKWAI